MKNILLASALLFTLAACGGGGGDSEPDPSVVDPGSSGTGTGGGTNPGGPPPVSNAADCTDPTRTGQLCNKRILGPFNASQRSTALLIDHADNDIWLLGTNGGGVWRSTDAGVSWTQLDPMNKFGATPIDFEQDENDENIIFYLAVGQNAGVYKSTDRGLTFAPIVTRTSNSVIGGFDYNLINLSVINSRVYFQSTGGVFETDYNGSTITTLLDAPFVGPYIHSLTVSRKNSTDEYVFFGQEDTVWRRDSSDPHGTPLTESHKEPKASRASGNNTPLGRALVASSKSDPKILYVAYGVVRPVAAGKTPGSPQASLVYKSEDFGASWTKKYDRSGLGEKFTSADDIAFTFNFFNGLVVDDDNPDQLIVSSTAAAASLDGGVSWHVNREGTTSTVGNPGIFFGDFWPNSFTKVPGTASQFVMGTDHSLLEAELTELFDTTNPATFGAIKTLVPANVNNRLNGVAAFTAYTGAIFDSGFNVLIAGQDRGGWLVKNGTETSLGGGDINAIEKTANSLHLFRRFSTGLLSNFDLDGKNISSVGLSNKITGYGSNNQTAVGFNNMLYYATGKNKEGNATVSRSTDEGTTLINFYLSTTHSPQSVTASKTEQTITILEVEDGTSVHRVRKLDSNANVIKEYTFPSNSDTDRIEEMYAGIDESVFYAVSRENIFKVDLDAGTSLDITGDLPGQVSGENIDIRSVASFDDKVIFVGTDFGIFTTKNGGTNWVLEDRHPTVSAQTMIIRHSDNTLFSFNYGLGALVMDISLK